MEKVLTTSNPHLRSRASREAAVYRTVATSSAIEGIRVAKKKAKIPDAVRSCSSEKHAPKDK